MIEKFLKTYTIKPLKFEKINPHAIKSGKYVIVGPDSLDHYHWCCGDRLFIDQFDSVKEAFDACNKHHAEEISQYLEEVS